MKPQELRIGNYVMDDKTKSVCTVDGIHHPNEDVVTEDKRYDDWFRTITPAPIPLTEEWLLKFGFDKSQIFGTYAKESSVGCLVELDYKYIFFYSTKEPSTQFESKIKHVHQLQNLFYALTGEELTIKDLTK